MSKFITVTEEQYKKLEELANANDEEISRRAKQLAVLEWQEKLKQEAKSYMYIYKELRKLFGKLNRWYDSISFWKKWFVKEPPIWADTAMFSKIDQDVYEIKLYLDDEINRQASILNDRLCTDIK